MSINIYFKGGKAFIKAMAMKQVTATNATKKLVKEYGAKLQASEMRLVPVDTGNLKRSITLSEEDGGLTAVIEPTADYAAYVEYGTRHAGAQPYIRPSVNKITPEFIAKLKKLRRGF